MTSVAESTILPAMRADARLASGSVLIFDLSEVLVGGLFGVIAPLADRVATSQQAVAEALGGEVWLALMEGRIDEGGYWRSILERTGWPIPASQLAALVRNALRRPVPGMPELLARLAGHPLALLSDHGREWMEFIDRFHPFLKTIDRRFLSFEMGQTKRRVETFHRVVGELGCAPHRCLFIDDLSENVERALAAGIPSIRFRSAGRLAEDLAAAGVTLA